MLPPPTSAKSLKPSDTHGLAAAKKAELSKMAAALGTRRDYAEGEAFDREKQEEMKIQRAAQREERDARREEDRKKMQEQREKYEAERKERERLRRREEDRRRNMAPPPPPPRDYRDRQALFCNTRANLGSNIYSLQTQPASSTQLKSASSQARRP